MLIFEICAYRIRRTQPNILTYAVNDAMNQLYSPQEVAPLFFRKPLRLRKATPFRSVAFLCEQWHYTNLLVVIFVLTMTACQELAPDFTSGAACRVDVGIA